MQRRIDRTLVIAGVIIVLVALLQHSPDAIGQTSGPQIQSNSGSASGRYQLVINPQVRADTFLLDTATGRIWTKVQYTDLKGQPTVWRPEDRVNSDAEFVAWARQFKEP
jgi:hypothetical protein